MTKIIICGANGQLGMAFRDLAAHFPDYEFVFTDVEELDITNPNAVNDFVLQQKPAFLINCAAFTAVDKAEEEEGKAMLLNAQAPSYLANACKGADCRLVHVSTDYVFDGNYFRPYSESHPVSPNSAYGRTKLAGERSVLDISNNAIIVRTSWLYSTTGHNFVKTIQKYGAERDMLKVVFDQVGTPTFAPDLAMGIMKLLQNTHSIEGNQIYHFSNEGVCSWYDFALEIIEMSGIDCLIKPVETKDYPLPANRPHYSVLNKEKIREITQWQIPHWKDSLKKCISDLGKKK